MATKNRTNKKRGAKSSSGKRMTLASRLERELPRRVGEYVNEVQALLDRLEREFQRASQRTRLQATRLLRQASRQLGSIEERGQSNWMRLLSRYREEAARMLRALEGAIAPSAAIAKGARKATTRRAAPRRATKRARKG